MTTNMRILMTAEPYGFGPSSKALAVARKLDHPSVELDFVGVGTALSAAQRERDLFRVVSASDRHDDGLLSEVAGKYDLVISVMEPSLALAAAASAVPCLYVDSLFWMWDWPDRFADENGPDEQLIRDLTGGTPTVRFDALHQALRLPMHEGQFVAHRVANLVCYQRYGAETTRSAARDACRTIPVGAIIDEAKALSPRQIQSSPALVVSVSGLSNELTDQEHAEDWATAVIGLIDDAVRGTAFEGGATRVGGNPEVLNKLHRDSRWSLEVKPWESHGEFMHALKGSTAFAAPPGITSVAESWSARVPFFALPNQHYAHSTILERLRSGDAAAFPGIETSQVQSVEDLTDTTAVVLKTVITDLRNGTQTRADATYGIKKFLSQASGDPVALLQNQSDQLSSIFGSADGASEVAAEAVRIISENARFALR